MPLEMTESLLLKVAVEYFYSNVGFLKNQPHVALTSVYATKIIPMMTSIKLLIFSHIVSLVLLDEVFGLRNYFVLYHKWALIYIVLSIIAIQNTLF